MNLAYKKNKKKSFGIWEGPPPHVGKNSQIISFFLFDSVPNSNFFEGIDQYWMSMVLFNLLQWLFQNESPLVWPLLAYTVYNPPIQRTLTRLYQEIAPPYQPPPSPIFSVMENWIFDNFWYDLLRIMEKTKITSIMYQPSNNKSLLLYSLPDIFQHLCVCQLFSILAAGAI